MARLSENAKRHLRMNMTTIPEADLRAHLSPRARATEGLDPHTLGTIEFELEVLRPWREEQKKMGRKFD